MNRFNFSFLFSLFLSLNAMASNITAGENVWHLSFDEGKGHSTCEEVNDEMLTISPSCDWIRGIEGSAMLFNGFTTRMVVPSEKSPNFGDSFSVDLFFAPAGYPKAPCPIIYNHRGTHPFSLEIDLFGRVLFAIGTQQLISQVPLTLRTWNRISCCYDSQN